MLNVLGSLGEVFLIRKVFWLFLVSISWLILPPDLSQAQYSPALSISQRISLTDQQELSARIISLSDIIEVTESVGDYSRLSKEQREKRDLINRLSSVDRVLYVVDETGFFLLVKSHVKDSSAKKDMGPSDLDDSDDLFDDPFETDEPQDSNVFSFHYLF